ncbi:hypothetical protein [Cryobacterium ruanii]|uniref:Uncharacterized protein n=1 Tax=Cryobacterium ruanii TaxID=1259197 RepID=A0A4R9ALD6_9MICO|nr:hypothetical protein [Cryobacterium ruanii]TFD65159.1 hypothetical protein E3T47_09860 [Cryobacterium ruanii]
MRHSNDHAASTNFTASTVAHAKFASMQDMKLEIDDGVEYFDSTLDVALVELRRLRDIQIAISTSMYSRASILVSASAIAATFTAAASSDLWLLLPSACFIFAALAGVRVIFPAMGLSIDASKIMEVARGLSAIQLKYEFATGLVEEYFHQDRILRIQSTWSRCGLIGFIAGTIAAAAIAFMAII